ncbi:MULTISPECIES: hypothetical protein [unclassified Bradyrhizobium]|uniref:hypothetical protein n=1 Tax=unclassified Bradyrhizobium TaxID=2631580 RepID=UPI0029170581|nr:MULTISPECIES: hypothetical protein [unclassified Bradyrhizobium]
MALTLLISLLLAPLRALASDHADPTDLTDPSANITDLFFFPKDDQYILIFNVRRALTAPQPYDLTPYEYRVNFDLTTPVKFDSAEDRARYGGTIAAPDKLHADATITVHLNNDATLKSIAINGLKATDRVKTYTGVRDDPFNFPRFYKVNVIAMVMSLPKDAFPAGQHDFILWGTASKDGTEIDHVGRSIRTQLPRFGIINTSPPAKQLTILMDAKESRDNLYNFFKGKKEWYSKAIADLIQPIFQLRKYDLMPDVMVYSDRFPVGYPNGRLLTDDVVAQTCAFGDCLLQELSYIEGGWPRATTNDKPFLDSWPYLPEPWPERPEPAASTQSLIPYILGIALVVAFVSWAVIELLRRLIVCLWFKARARPKPV